MDLPTTEGHWACGFCRSEFVAYADTCFQLFGDRVNTWVTINEPISSSVLVSLLICFLCAQSMPPPCFSSPRTMGKQDFNHLFAIMCPGCLRQLPQQCCGKCLSTVAQGCQYEPAAEGAHYPKDDIVYSTMCALCMAGTHRTSHHAAPHAFSACRNRGALSQQVSGGPSLLPESSHVIPSLLLILLMGNASRTLCYGPEGVL